MRGDCGHGGYGWFRSGENWRIAGRLDRRSQGKRNTLEYVEAPVPVDAWHTLRVEFASKRIRVALNGTWYIDLEDGAL